MFLASGSNFFGQLGIGLKERAAPNEIVPFGECEEQTLNGAQVADIQCGSQFTVVLQKSGNISLCGTLNGTVYPLLSPLEIQLPIKCEQVACGRRHILLLMQKNIVMSWGTGYFGQLGHGDDTSWDSPRMISALDPKRLGCRVQSVACGASHSGVVTDSGRVFMWGLNRSGQCGQSQSTKGKNDSILEPRPVDFSKSNIGTGESGPILARSLVCGRNHSAIVAHTGRVYVWGEAGLGRLGLNEAKKAQLVPGEVVAFRSMPVAQLAAGDFHMLALTVEGHVYSWGFGADGATGHSTMLNVRCPRRVEFFDDLRVREVVCGATWSMAVSVQGYLYAFGYGDGGWLGLEPPSAEEGLEQQVEVDSLSPAQAALLPESHREICCFDSRYSVLWPKKVDSLADYSVRTVRAGAGHSVFLCEPRDSGEEQQLAGVKHSPRDQQASSSASSESSTPILAPGKSPTVPELLGGRRASSNPVSSKYDAKPSSTFALGSQGPRLPGGDISGSGGSTSSLQQRVPPHLQHLYSGDVVGQRSINSTGASSSSASMPPLSPHAAVAQVFSWCRHRKIVELSSYLAQGGDADCLDGAGNTPLIVACQNGSMQICKLLLANGADINARNYKGNTSLHYSYNYGYEDIGNYLIEQGADDLQTNAEGLTCYEGLTHSDLELL